MSFRGTDWHRARARALRRDHDTCQHCGKSGQGLQVHHVRPFNLFDDWRVANKLANLLTLCPPCHARADNKFWADHPELFGKRRPPMQVEAKRCEGCESEYEPTSNRSKLCEACRTIICGWCGKSQRIRLRNDRVPRFCSKACNVAFRQSERIWPRACLDCSVKIQGRRLRCRRCHDVRVDAEGRDYVLKATGRRASETRAR